MWLQWVKSMWLWKQNWYDYKGKIDVIIKQNQCDCNTTIKVKSMFKIDVQNRCDCEGKTGDQPTKQHQ